MSNSLPSGSVRVTHWVPPVVEIPELASAGGQRPVHLLIERRRQQVEMDAVLGGLALRNLVEHQARPPGRTLSQSDGSEFLRRVRVDGRAEDLRPELREPGGVLAVERDGLDWLHS